jgi:hypothetical protein
MATMPAQRWLRSPVVHAEQLDTHFFSTLFATEVRSVQQERIGVGLIGMNVRCTLEHSSSTAPTSVVVKLPSPDETSRATGIALGNYEREVYFYRDLAASLPITKPQCWFADWLPEQQDFTLVLEDLAPAEPGDQLTGCSVDTARLVLGELAQLHAPRWNDPTLFDVGFLQRRTAEDVERLVMIYAMFWPGFADKFGHRLTAEQVDLGQSLIAGLPAWVGSRGEPWTVTHGDFRLDNQLFGQRNGVDTVWTVDWQTPGHGPASSDLSYFIGAGLLTPDRRAHERALVEHYAAAMAAHGVDVDLDTWWEQYCRDSVSGILVTVVASMVTGETERSGEMFGVMAERHFTHAVDVDASRFWR